MMPRWMHRFYAKFMGYFWLPCPICGEYFAGYEPDAGSWYQGGGSGQTVCVNCSGEAQRRTAAAIEEESP